MSPEQIKAARKLLGLTQSQAAHLAGMNGKNSAQTFRRWELDPANSTAREINPSAESLLTSAVERTMLDHGLLVAFPPDDSAIYVIRLHHPGFVAEVIETEDGYEMASPVWLDTPPLDAGILAQIMREAGEAIAAHLHDLAGN